MIWLGAASSGRLNNFNLIRMVAASSVLLSHSWPVTLGIGTVEPLEAGAGFALGRIAVLAFFVISGFFIAKSFTTKRHFSTFLAARLLRIFPALAVVLVLTLFVLGPIFTDLPLARYFAEPRTLTYVPRNLTLALLQVDLPGVFTANPYPVVVNGPLWTLAYEVGCYGMLVLAGAAGLLKPRSFPGFLAALALCHVILFWAVPDRFAARQFVILSTAFATGMTAYVWREYVPLSFPIAFALAVLAALARGTALYPYAFILALAYGSFWLGHVDWWGRSPYNRLGDYSYGTYIYAFPVQQMTIVLLPGLAPLPLAGTSFVVTLGFAVLSWHVVERRALDRRQAFGRWLRP